MTNRSSNDSAAPPAPFEERRRRAASRSNCYGLLALAFRDAPTAEIVAKLRAPPLAEALGQLGYDVADDLGGDLAAATARLREEYTRAFVGPGPHVSPYGSVHQEKEGGLWGDSTVRARRFLAATGLSFVDDREGIPDHIAVELELMQRLSAREAELWARRAAAPEGQDEGPDDELVRCLQAEAEFLRDHLGRWVPGFCDRLLAHSTCLFYREMARLAEAIVLSDAEERQADLRDLRAVSSAQPGQRREGWRGKAH